MAKNIVIGATVNQSQIAAGVVAGIQAGAKSAPPVNVRVNIPNVDLKKAFLPLGKITGDLNQFQSSLDASVARVLAFGASASVISGAVTAFKSLITTGIEVEKTLTDINVILNLSSSGLAKFSSDLFNTARNTGQSFKEVGAAAIELSRQGLSSEETIKRLNDALILSRLSGLDAAESVSTLTATINGFNSEALSSTEIVNRLASVDAAFAVSTNDLANALSRSGAVAQDAGVSFNELIAAVTSVQQTTARGGSVIGNALKSIFTRLQRSTTREELEAIGVATSDASGNFRGAIPILEDYARVYQTLSDEQKASTAETIAGVYQINTLKSLIGDLNKEYSVYSGALRTANGATDEAVRRNEELNKTTAALLSQTGTSLQQFGANLSSLLTEQGTRNILTAVNSLASGLAKILDEKEGSVFARSFVQGIGDFIAGPGLIIVGKAFFNLIKFLAADAVTAFQQIQSINVAKQQQQQVEAAIGSVLKNNQTLVQSIIASEGNRIAQQQIILGAIKQEEDALKRISVLRNAISAAAASGQVAISKTLGGPVVKTKATGYIPNFSSSNDQERMGALQAGYVPGRVFNQKIYDGQGGSFTAKVNSAEDIKTIMGPNGQKGTYVIPPTWAAQGYIPNFAITAQEEWENWKKTLKGIVPSTQKINNAPISDAAKIIGKTQLGKGIKIPSPNSREVQKQERENIAKAAGIITSVKSQRQLGLIVPTLNKASEIQQASFLHKESGLTFSANVPYAGYNPNPQALNQKSVIDFEKRADNIIVAWAQKYTRDLFGAKAKNSITSIKDLANQGAVGAFKGTVFETAIRAGTQDTIKADSETGVIDFPVVNDNLRTLFNNLGTKAYEAKVNTSPDNVSSVVSKYWKTYQSDDLAKAIKLRKNPEALVKKTAASGYIPNFAMDSVMGAVQNAIDRERAAGIPTSAIRIDKSPKLKNERNPLGLAVTNTIDEPRGLRDVQYASNGYIPNFAAEFDTAQLNAVFNKLKISLPDKELIVFKQMVAESITNYRAGNISQRQFFKELNQLGQTAGIVDKDLKNFTRSISTARIGLTQTLGGKIPTAGATAATGVIGGNKALVASLIGTQVGAGLQASQNRTAQALGSGISTGFQVAGIAALIPGIGPLAAAVIGGVTGISSALIKLNDTTIIAQEKLNSISQEYEKTSSSTGKYLESLSSLKQAQDELDPKKIEAAQKNLSEAFKELPLVLQKQVVELGDNADAIQQAFSRINDELARSKKSAEIFSDFTNEFEGFGNNFLRIFNETSDKTIKKWEEFGDKLVKGIPQEKLLSADIQRLIRTAAVTGPQRNESLQQLSAAGILQPEIVQQAISGDLDAQGVIANAIKFLDKFGIKMAEVNAEMDKTKKAIQDELNVRNRAIKIAFGIQAENIKNRQAQLEVGAKMYSQIALPDIKFNIEDMQAQGMLGTYESQLSIKQFERGSDIIQAQVDRGQKLEEASAKIQELINKTNILTVGALQRDREFGEPGGVNIDKSFSILEAIQNKIANNTLTRDDLSKGISQLIAIDSNNATESQKILQDLDKNMRDSINEQRIQTSIHQMSLIQLKEQTRRNLVTGIQRGGIIPTDTKALIDLKNSFAQFRSRQPLTSEQFGTTENILSRIREQFNGTATAFGNLANQIQNQRSLVRNINETASTIGIFAPRQFQAGVTNFQRFGAIESQSQQFLIQNQKNISDAISRVRTGTAGRQEEFLFTQVQTAVGAIEAARTAAQDQRRLAETLDLQETLRVSPELRRRAGIRGLEGESFSERFRLASGAIANAETLRKLDRTLTSEDRIKLRENLKEAGVDISTRQKFTQSLLTAPAQKISSVLAKYSEDPKTRSLANLDANVKIIVDQLLNRSTTQQVITTAPETVPEINVTMEALDTNALSQLNAYLRDNLQSTMQQLIEQYINTKNNGTNPKAPPSSSQQFTYRGGII